MRGDDRNGSRLHFCYERVTLYSRNTEQEEHPTSVPFVHEVDTNACQKLTILKQATLRLKIEHVRTSQYEVELLWAEEAHHVLLEDEHFRFVHADAKRCFIESESQA